MNILDENIPEEQRFMLAKWRVPFRQIGFEVGQKGLKDPAIIPLLLTLPHPTFFTRDMDFCKRSLCHARYSLIVMDVDEAETAISIRRLLRHPRFNTQAKRMGTVIRISATGLSVFYLHALTEEHIPWHDAAGQTLGAIMREETAPYTVDSLDSRRLSEHL